MNKSSIVPLPTAQNSLTGKLGFDWSDGQFSLTGFWPVRWFKILLTNLDSWLLSFQIKIVPRTTWLLLLTFYRFKFTDTWAPNSNFTRDWTNLQFAENLSTVVKYSDAIAHVSMCASVLMIVSLTFERHFAICNPHKWVSGGWKCYGGLYDFVTVLPIPNALSYNTLSDSSVTYWILWLFGPCPMVVTESDIPCNWTFIFYEDVETWLG